MRFYRAVSVMFCAVWVYLFLLAAGCSVSPGLPDFGAEARPASSYFPKDIPLNYGPRANECKERKATGDLEGLAVKQTADGYELKWSSEPKTNDISPMQAVAKGTVKIHCAYPNVGVKGVYIQEAVPVDVEPGQSRLLSGTIIIPLSDIAPAARAYRPEMLFDSISIESRMEGLVFQSADLTFDYMGTKEGTASARWKAETVRVTMKAVVTADNAAPAALDTGAWEGSCTCSIYNKDGKLITSDKVSPQKGERGFVTAVGFIRLPNEVWKTVDWKRSTARWEFVPPAEKE